MRKLIISCVLTALFSLTASAGESVGDVVVSLQIDNPVMEVNGVSTGIDETGTATPVILDGRTLVPVRAVIEAFGGDVAWEQSTQTAVLTMEGDVIRLIINSNTAYFNDVAYMLDVAPAIINDRTMLPVRFVAENFNLGVAWDGDTKTVSIIRNTFDEQEYEFLQSVLPEYSGQPYVVINNNIPMFKEYEIIPASFEYYSKLDGLGRCDVAMSSVSTDIMPTDERGSISSVTPTGWKNKSYDNIPGGYLYNRCHLIGYQLTGENANEKNLITGTRYMNIEGMLPFENMVDGYAESTGNNIMYRVTPVFTGNNLVADGVLMEAYSVEDNGAGISFCVYCYNVQPEIAIDYSTGDNSYIATVVYESAIQPADGRIYRTPTGKRYHLDPDCGGKNSYETTLNEAVSAGLTPCLKCAG